MSVAMMTRTGDERRTAPGSREYMTQTRAAIAAAIDSGDEARLKEIGNATARAVAHTVIHGGGHMLELAELSELAKDGLNLCIARRVRELRRAVEVTEELMELDG